MEGWTHVKAKERARTSRTLVRTNAPGGCVEGAAAMASSREWEEGRERGRQGRRKTSTSKQNWGSKATVVGVGPHVDAPDLRRTLRRERSDAVDDMHGMENKSEFGGPAGCGGGKGGFTQTMDGTGCKLTVSLMRRPVVRTQGTVSTASTVRKEGVWGWLGRALERLKLWTVDG